MRRVVILSFLSALLFACGSHSGSGASGARSAGTVPSSVASVEAAPSVRQMPATFPNVPGEYVSSKQHPRVFETQSDLNDMARRINVSGSYSAQQFARLTTAVKAYVASKMDWDATYSGCDIYTYLHAFSIEQQSGYAGQTRSDDELAKALKVKPGASPPLGAAVVASRLALYAALVKAGATVLAGAPSADQPTSVAKRILLAWADHGFRDESGSYRRTSTQYCTADGKPSRPIAIALQVARGVTYSAQAQDLLQGIGAFNAEEEGRLDRFDGSIYDVIRNLSNEELDASMASKNPDETYNNQFASHLTALIATARLLDDGKRVEAALDGGDAALTVKLPWKKLFNYVIYGESDQPMLHITPNSNDDPLKSSPAYSTSIVAAGEINDRYRNATADQGIGYPMGTLGWFYMTAENLRGAGYNLYGYRGSHQQTIEMATQYYACYAQHVGFRNTITADNATACPDYRQYIGKVVDSVETNIVIGAYRFPTNAAITAVESAAKAALLRDPIDTARFGRWRD
jgi:hypothetical protein